MLLHPEWDRSCSDCQRWVYRDDDQTPPNERGERLIFAGQPIPRDLRVTPTPCFKCEKVPYEVRTKAADPSQLTHADAIEPEIRHRLAVQFHLECNAVRQFPNDPLVRRNARIIQPIVEERDRRPLELLIATVTAALAKR